MSAVDFKGIFPPIPTPFVDGRVAYDKLQSNVEKWSRTGIRGFVVLGSNGESVLLSEEEKRKIVATVARTAPARMSIIAGTGCESTAETIRLTADCARLGAQAALVVTPHYYSAKMNAAALTRHYTVVADHAPVPILLYNVPKYTGVNLTADIVTPLSAHPNIIGIKDSSGSVSLLGEYLNNTGAEFNVLVGTAGVLFGGLSLGCTGAIVALANIAPWHCVKIFNHVQTGDFDTAAKMQRLIIPANKAVTATYGVPGLKAALDMLGYFGGEPRLPLLPASETEKTAIRRILAQAGII